MKIWKESLKKVRYKEKQKEMTATIENKDLQQKMPEVQKGIAFTVLENGSFVVTIRITSDEGVSLLGVSFTNVVILSKPTHSEALHDGELPPEACFSFVVTGSGLVTAVLSFKSVAGATWDDVLSCSLPV